MGERRTCNAEAIGSIPISSTKIEGSLESQSELRGIEPDVRSGGGVLLRLLCWCRVQSFVEFSKQERQHGAI